VYSYQAVLTVLSSELVRVLYGIQENRGAVFIKALVLWW
jgi:hypothetical protein